MNNWWESGNGFRLTSINFAPIHERVIKASLETIFPSSNMQKLATLFKSTNRGRKNYRRGEKLNFFDRLTRYIVFNNGPQLAQGRERREREKEEIENCLLSTLWKKDNIITKWKNPGDSHVTKIRAPNAVDRPGNGERTHHFKDLGGPATQHGHLLQEREWPILRRRKEVKRIHFKESTIFLVRDHQK